MPQFYKVVRADKIGDPYTPNQPNAKPIQSWWCQVAGVELPVMINKQVPNSPSLTEGHYGVIEKRQGKKSEYYKFTSMQIPQGVSKPTYDDAPAPVHQDMEGEPYWFKPYRKRIDDLEKAVGVSNDIDDTVDEDKLKDIFGEDIKVQEIPNE